MKNKLLILSLIIITVLASVTMVYANSTGTVNLKASQEQVKVGETFTVTLSATCEDGINGIDTTYNYDTDKLELISASVKDGSSWANLGTDNQITVICNTTSKVTNADIYVLTFKVKSGAKVGEKATISTTGILLDSDAATGSEVQIDAKQVSVTIAEEKTVPEQNTTGNTDGNTAGSTASNVTGNKVDTTSKSAQDTSTASATKLPKTGENTIKMILIVVSSVLLIVGYVTYKKYQTYKNI